MNEYVEFYEKNKISPVRQNIDDFSLHVKRREALYRQLGLLKSNLENKKILEVGPGGGYNAMATYTFNPSKYVFVEPNKTGYEELKENFFKKDFISNVEFHNCFLEKFESQEKFDIVICEGLIQGLPNRNEFLSSLSKKVKAGGVLIITVADEISMFFEILRRYLANELIKNEDNFEKQIDILVGAFSSHLDTLKGMTRRHDDWCADLICDAIYNHTFSIADAIKFFKKEYFFYGASPNVFQDFRWYKALPYTPNEYNEYYLNQFNSGRHNFINSLKIYNERDENLNFELSNDCKKIIIIIKSLEKGDGVYKKEDLIGLLSSISNNVKEVDNLLHVSIEEIRKIIVNNDIKVDTVASVKELKHMFGRGQTFISFYKLAEEN